MANATLVFAENTEYGFQGWRLKRHPTFDPVDASGVAHDLLEHYPSDMGKVIQEMRALGAYTFTRIESGLMYETYKGRMSVGEILGDDIRAVFGNAIAYGYKGSHLKEKSSRWRLLDYDIYEDAFAQALAYVRDQWEVEAGNDDELLALAPEYFSGHGEAVILTALRTGFRWAKQRYKEPYRAALLFQEIRKKVENVQECAHLDDEIVVHYGLESLKVRVTHRDAYGQERW